MGRGPDKEKRQPRNDRKNSINPSLDLNLFECVAALSYVTNKPMKTVGEEFIVQGLSSKKVMALLAKHFRRNLYWDEKILYVGELTRSQYKGHVGAGKKRLSLRFPILTHERIEELAFALDCSVSLATAFILETSIKESEILKEFLKKSVSGKLDLNREDALQSVIKYVNTSNPFHESIFLAPLLALILKGVYQGVQVIKSWVVRSDV